MLGKGVRPDPPLPTLDGQAGGRCNLVILFAFLVTIPASGVRVAAQWGKAIVLWWIDLQQHTGELCERLGANGDTEVDWVLTKPE